MKSPKKEPLALLVCLMVPPGNIIFPILQKVILLDQQNLANY